MGHSEARAKAWVTRRSKHGPRGHSGSYSRSPAERGALKLVIRLHVEGVLSEGQVASATGLDRVVIRSMADADRPSLREGGE